MRFFFIFVGGSGSSKSWMTIFGLLDTLDGTFDDAEAALDPPSAPAFEPTTAVDGGAVSLRLREFAASEPEM